MYQKSGIKEQKIRLAQKMARRNPGEAPQLGDRIQYIVIKSPFGQNKKMCDRAEDPLYVLEHGLAIDYVYYADNQLLNPLTNVLAIAMPHCTKEDIKDKLWPCITFTEGKDLPPRPSKKPVNGSTKRSRINTKYDNIAPSFGRITSHFLPVNQSCKSIEIEKSAEDGARELDDIEEICARLVRECIACKKGDENAVATCKNRDCSRLYDRYSQKRRISSGGYTVENKDYVRILGIN